MTSRRLAASVTTLLMGVAVLVATPTSVGAAEDPVVEDSGDTVTYTDPALDRARTTTVEGTLQIAYVDRVDRAGRPTAELQYAVTTDDGESVPIEVDEDLPASAA